MTPIETRHLRHFVAVAETGSFQKAAQRVHLSQPAVTKSIQRMEHWFGHKLFDRSAKLELTDFGNLVLERARTTLIEFDDLQHEADLFRNLAVGELILGAGPLMAESIVGPAVGRLMQRHPQLRITVHVDNFGQFPDLLRHRQLDLFVADITAIQSDADFEITFVPPQEAVWFCRPGHPLAGRAKVSLSEYFAFPIILPMLPTWTTEWFSKHYPAAMREKRGPFRAAVTCSHFSTLKSIVLNSDSISGATPAALAMDLAEKRFVPIALDALKLFTNPGIVSLKGRTLSPAALAVVEEIRGQMTVLSNSANGRKRNAAPARPPIPASAAKLRRREVAALR